MCFSNYRIGADGESRTLLPINISLSDVEMRLLLCSNTSYTNYSSDSLLWLQRIWQTLPWVDSSPNALCRFSQKSSWVLLWTSKIIVNCRLWPYICLRLTIETTLSWYRVFDGEYLYSLTSTWPLVTIFLVPMKDINFLNEAFVT